MSIVKPEDIEPGSLVEVTVPPIRVKAAQVSGANVQVQIEEREWWVWYYFPPDSTFRVIEKPDPLADAVERLRRSFKTPLSMLTHDDIVQQVIDAGWRPAE